MIAKKFIYPLLAFASLLAFTLPCTGGEKGFSAIIINIGDQDFYDSAIFRSFLTNYDARKLDACWYNMNLADGASGLTFISIFKRPPGITQKLGKEIWEGNLKSVAIARAAMNADSAEKKKTPDNEFHGLYIIKPEHNHLSLMAIGGNAKTRGNKGISQKINNIPLNEKNPVESAKLFERSLCRVSKPFNTGFSFL